MWRSSSHAWFHFIPARNLMIPSHSGFGETNPVYCSTNVRRGFSAACPGSVFECLGPWEYELVEKEQVDLPHSRENAYGKERRTSLPSYRSTIRHDPK